MKSFLVLAIFASILACAQPDYLSDDEPLSDNAEKPVALCPYSLTKKKICFSLNWNSAPSSKESNSFELEFSEPLEEKLLIKLWMPSMGHGSAPVTITHRDPKHISVSNVYFIMPGDWEIRISTRNAQDEIENQLNIPFLIP